MRIALISALCVAAGAAASASAQVVNGDFQTGVLSPSTTSYTQDATMLPPATWNLVAFDTIHPSWVDFADHTTGDSEEGWYMIVNGTDGGLGPAWAQLVELLPNTDYVLSAWFASLFPVSPASLQFRVIGDGTEDISATFQAPTDTAVWGERTFSFNSGGNAFVSLQIWDVNDQFTGNDYAIDDISLAVVPTPGSAALMGVGGLLLARRRRATVGQ